MGFVEEIVKQQVLWVQQRYELAELIGFETRNQYAITTEGGVMLAYAAEQGQGVFGFLGRYFLGHWRSFDIFVFDTARNKVIRAHHPFRWIFQRLEISSAQGRPLGALETHFSLFTKRFDVEDATGKVRMTVSSPLWRLWTFPFMKGERRVATVAKKWSGLLTEGLTDTDRFRIEFEDPRLTAEERQLLLAAALFIDIQYFERQAG
jgi:uncharacterized protein YxjI